MEVPGWVNHPRDSQCKKIHLLSLLSSIVPFLPSEKHTILKRWDVAFWQWCISECSHQLPKKYKCLSIKKYSKEKRVETGTLQVFISVKYLYSTIRLTTRSKWNQSISIVTEYIYMLPVSTADSLWVGTCWDNSVVPCHKIIHCMFVKLFCLTLWL